MKINERVIVMRDFARNLARLSKCTDRHIAAIICNKELDQIYSIGINGGAKGGLDCLCNMGQKYTCVHAEANALAKCSTFDRHKVMFATVGPCVTCAAMIVNSGFDTVYIDERWKKPEGEQILRDGGIEIRYVGEEALRNANIKKLVERLQLQIGIEQTFFGGLTDEELDAIETRAAKMGYECEHAVAYSENKPMYTTLVWRSPK